MSYSKKPRVNLGLHNGMENMTLGMMDSPSKL